MRSTPKTARRLAQLLIVIAALLVPLLSAETASASHEHRYYLAKYSHNRGPCPNWSIDAVLADIAGDWDRDNVTNGNEVFQSNGLNPCVSDSQQFCERSPKYCEKPKPLVEPVHLACHHGKWTWDQVRANPHGDWDVDGVSNAREAEHGARPCVSPCPTAYLIDVTLNPHSDWDRDGRTNQYEVDTGTNVCTYNAPAHVRVAAPQPRLPHVGASDTHTHPSSVAHTHANGNVAHTPTNITPKVECPAGYPYLHPSTGRCHANPILPY